MRESQLSAGGARRRVLSILTSSVVIFLCALSIYLHLGNTGGTYRVVDGLNTAGNSAGVVAIGPKDWCSELNLGGRLEGDITISDGPLMGGPFYGLFQTDGGNLGIRVELGPTGIVALIAPRSDSPGAISAVESLRPIRLEERIQFSVSKGQLLISGAGWSASSTGQYLPLCSDVRIGSNYDDSRTYPGEVFVTIKSQRYELSGESNRRVMIVFCIAVFLISMLLLGRMTLKEPFVNDKEISLVRIESFLLKAAILLVLLVPFVLVTLGRVWAISDGWFMSWSKIFQDSLIYRDVAFPYPPLSLIEGFIPLLSERVFLTEQVYHFAIWIVFCVASYRIASEVSRKSIAVFTTVTLAAIYFAMPFNFVAGYFELALMLLFLGLALFPRGEDGPSWRTYKIFFAGMCFVMAALTKQTFALVPIILTLYLTKKRLENRVSSRSFMSWIFGISAPLFMVLAWSVKNRNLGDLLRNLLSGGGKGDVASGLIERIFDWGLLRALNGTSLSVFIYLTPLSVLLITRKVRESRLKIGVERSLPNSELILMRLLKSVEMSLLLLTIWSLLSVSAPDALPVYGHAFRIIALAVVMVLIAIELTSSSSLKLSDTIRGEYSRLKLEKLLILGGLSVVLAYLAVRLSRGQSFESFEKSKMFSGLSQTMTTLGVLLSVFLLLAYVLQLTTPTWRHIVAELGSHKEFRYLQSPKVCMAFITALLIPVLNSLSGWTTFETWYLILLLILPILIALLSGGRSLLVAVACLVYFVSLAASASEPYQWWGLQVPSLSETRMEPPSEALSGFLLDTDTVQYLAELRQITRSEASSDAVSAFYGPQNVGLQFVLEIDAMSTKCLVMWWDVCSMADQNSTLEQVKTKRPNYIVWNIPPSAVADGHDFGFNTGKSAISRVPNFLQEMVSEGSYVKRANLAIPGSEGWSTVVLERVQ